MEGLIPLVYRTIKRTRTRRQYQCLSPATAAADGAFNIQDFYPNGYYGGGGNMIAENDYDYNGDRRKGAAESVGADGRRHRRHMSLQVEYSGGFSPERGAAASNKSSKQLVRFKSHRMFSCVTGAY
ncbi:PREDICTED: uncharacterized protein LOC109169843 [Ipomoea nil]|uniref:uncharacterized protein LOC109169843 n=1 Tax=Ipomoea nil TaxID=35883 RepID=UPI000901AC62|nr:PREDICTED: uncharacterized protein LOC109169843 [Ipomoea nil]